MKYAGLSPSDMNPEQLQAAHEYVCDAIINTRDHLRLLSFAIVEIEAEQERRKVQTH